MIEVLLVAVIFLIILFVVLTVMHRGMTFFWTASASASLQENARKALDRMAADLRGTGLSIITDSLGQPLEEGEDYQEIRFRRNPGYRNPDIPWDEGEAIIYRFAYREGEEINNGTDDDGDGLIDEGVLVRAEDVDFESIDDDDYVEMTHNVKEGGLTFTLDGSKIVIWVELEDINYHQRRFEVSDKTTVYLRNP